MIQLNLLPDVKIAFIKARAQKRLVILGSVVVGSASLAIFALMLVYVSVVQSKSSSDLSKDISNTSQELSSTKDLNKILTVQNQLLSIDGLHDLKPSVERLPSYIAKTTPKSIKLSQYTVDYTTQTIITAGRTGSLDKVNAYADTLKFMMYTTTKDEQPKHAFNDVVLSSFTRSQEGASFTMDFKYDKSIFDSKQEISFSIAKKPGGGLLPIESSNNNAFDGEGQ